jgi:hypothetical protein
MKDKDIHSEISSIKNIMERSTKFISLSGLSGILAGVYALIGAGVAYFTIKDSAIDTHRVPFFEALGNVVHILITLIITAATVLILSLITGYLLSVQKAKRKGASVWNKTSKLLLFNMSVPLFTGAIIIAMMMYQGNFSFIVSVMLLFYGLSLFNAGNFTYGEIKYLGILEIVLGLIIACWPQYSLLGWTLGFGVLHIVYGAIMYFKYDRENNVN